MNYYKEIKDKILDNEAYERVKDYSKERHRVLTYFEIGRLLHEAGKHYGEGIIKQYSLKLSKELNRTYGERLLHNMRRFYVVFSSNILICPNTQTAEKDNSTNLHTVYAKSQESTSKSTKPSIRHTVYAESNKSTLCLSNASLLPQLSWSHYVKLITLDSPEEIIYYAKIAVNQYLSVRQLESKIKSKEYYRLDEKTKIKLESKENLDIKDYVPNPILIKNTSNKDVINEKILHNLIMEDIASFMKELGEGYCYIDSEFRILLGETYNYIDFLFFNIDYNCYVVVELKITELKKEHIGQIQVYMNYIDNTLRMPNQDKTIGIIICKQNNEYVIKYCSDERIISREYKII